jgi:hypothetical protein
MEDTFKEEDAEAMEATDNEEGELQGIRRAECTILAEYREVTD